MYNNLVSHSFLNAFSSSSRVFLDSLEFSTHTIMPSKNIDNFTSSLSDFMSFLSYTFHIVLAGIQYWAEAVRLLFSDLRRKAVNILQWCMIFLLSRTFQRCPLSDWGGSVPSLMSIFFLFSWKNIYLFICLKYG